LNHESAERNASVDQPSAAARVFVSSQAVDQWPAAQLIACLNKLGVSLEHSPSNPRDKPDQRWKDWYHQGLPATLRRCRLFVIVVDDGWDSSSWMAQEAHLALVAPGSEKRLRGYFWNPERRQVTAAGMVGYLQQELPIEAQLAARFLAQEAAAEQ
jgi:hypothetical protein